MSCLVDTCIWSEVIRKSSSNINIKKQFTKLVLDSQIIIIGAIRQEILSGIKFEKQFTTLNKYLQAFKDEEVITEDYVLAAQYFNSCRQKGIQGSNTDFLICAVSVRLNIQIFSIDKDFTFFQSCLPIHLMMAPC